jgi:hypothetical protein
MSNLHKLLNGQGIMVKDDDIVDACHHFPNMTQENYKKLEKAYNKGKACRLKLAQHELVGHGLSIKQVGRMARKVGKVAMKSGVGDLIINEAVGALPIPVFAQKAVATIAKKEARQLTGAGVNQMNFENNPYIPKILRGSGLQNYGVPISTHNDVSNIVPIDSDAYHPTTQVSNAYSNPINYPYRK